MSLAEVRPRRHLPSAPAPAVFDQMVDDAIEELKDMRKQYRWLYPSAYAKGRRETNERVRRGVSGSTGDVTADAAVGQDLVRRHVEEAGDHARKGLAHLKGVSTALGKAQDKIENAVRPVLGVDVDPLESSIAPPEYLRGMTPTEAKAWQAKRNARLGRDGAVRRRRQEDLILAVVRTARDHIEKGAVAPALAAAMADLDKESASFVSAPWGREEVTG